MTAPPPPPPLLPFVRKIQSAISLLACFPCNWVLALHGIGGQSVIAGKYNVDVGGSSFSECFGLRGSLLYKGRPGCVSAVFCYIRSTVCRAQGPSSYSNGIVEAKA
ncbi:hypothetical protein BCV70DRAFT_103294 [Testicularia cyperi]|uniref:Uncharacterized protein n=1 Tax=Testicularia cyperi TaxID=1882483 RepID=A0A317XQ08_9BASI|nr:hypothetical protein BCV70DRAFT_103294 [Testicularia cyperi]